MKTVVSLLILHNITEVTSQESPWYPDQCGSPYDYKCGSLCLYEDYHCYCGGDDWRWGDDKEDKRYCCSPPGDNQCTRYSDYNVNCSSGVLLPWYQPCHGACTGSPVITQNNCQYDCLARSDEVSVKQNETNIDQYADLQNCIDIDITGSYPGLKGTITNDVCKPNYQWCTEDISCHSEVSRDKLQLQRFCRNSTFWESQDCNKYIGGTVWRFGDRCRGSQQHCIYPAYRSYDYDTFRAAGFLGECKDKSDQIFERQSQCNMRAQLDIYCNHCQDNRSHSEWKYIYDCERKCEDREHFIAEQRDPNKEWTSRWGTTRKDALDPHNCQASCLEPGYGCTACENKKYFNCSSSSKCLHPDLVCDGVPQCPGAEDEECGKLLRTDAFFFESIFDKCKHKQDRSDAIMKCQSICEPTETISATPCNDVPECHNNADEPWICKNTTTIISGAVGGIFATIISIFIIVKIKTLNTKNKDIKFGKVLIFNIEEWHNNEIFRLFKIFPFLAVNRGAEQNETLKNISKEEEKFHKYNEFKTMLWIKNAYSKFEIKVMAEYLYPSLLKKIPPIKFILENFEKLTHSFEIFRWLWNKVRQISFVYIDLTKDISITATLILTIGITTVIDSPTAFPSVVVMCLFVSIILPFLLSSLQLAMDNPHLILGEKFSKQSRWKQVLGRIGIVLMAFINPALFIHAYESNQEQLKFQDLKDKKYEEIKKIMEKGELIQRQYVKYIRTELGFEVIFQIALQIILILQARTSSSTVSGLETVFGKSSSIGIDTDTLIILSILWSIKTCVTLHLKAADIEKTHLRIISKIGLILISLFCSCARLLAIITFFTPFIGLFNLLNQILALSTSK